MDQHFIDYIFYAVTGILGWVVKGLQDSMTSLRKADEALVVRVQNIELLVVGHYVKRDELDKLAEAIFTKLDRIEAKLDKKADR